MSMGQRLVGGDAPQDEPRLLPAAPGPVPPSGSVRAVFLRSWPGRTLLGAIAVRVLLAVADRAGVPALSSVLGLPVAVALVVSGLWVLWRVVAVARRRLLWRVRRKLIISYIFIGVVPALLVVAFFLFAGLLMFFHVSAYLFKRGIDDVMEDARSVAQTAAIELRRGRGEAATREVLERKLANSASEYPMLSIAVAPRSVGREGARSTEGLAAGPWAHDSPPRTIPEWVSTGGFTGLLAYHYPDDAEHDHLVIRAVGFPEDREPSFKLPRR